MRCPEFKDVMRAFLDGEVDTATRKAAGLHLAECPDCARLIESDRFWDETVRSYLHHELPADLRADILGDLAHVPVTAGEGKGDAQTTTGPGNLDNLGARDPWRVAWWAIKRDLRRPLTLLPTMAFAVAVLLAVVYMPRWRDRAPAENPVAPFAHAAPIVRIDADRAGSDLPRPDDPVPTARLALNGRLL